MSEFDMDVVRDFRRGAVRLHVLHHASEREVSGAWLAAELAKHGHRLSPGTLYPLLHDLEAAGLLVSTEQVEDGHRVRCYTATGEGRTTLTGAQEALSELAAELLPAGDAHRRSRGGPRAGRRRSTASNSAVEIGDDLNRLIDRLRAEGRTRDLRAQARYEAAAELLAGLRQLVGEKR